MSDVTADKTRSGPLAKLGFAFDAESSSLVLRERVFFDWLAVHRLALSLPELPASARAHDAGAVERFQQRRSYLRDAVLRVTQERLDHYLHQRSGALRATGIHNMSARCYSGYVTLAGRVTEGKNTADATARMYLAARGQDIRVLMAEARVYGYLPSAMPVVGHRLCAALLDIDGASRHLSRAAGPHYPRVIGLGQFELSPLRAVLWNTMAPAGWRLPSTARARLTGVRITRSGIDISFADDASSDATERDEGAPLGSADTTALQAAYEQLQTADNDLLAGNIDDALRAYRGELAAGGPEQPHVIERILSVESAHPAYFSEAADFARQTLARYPDYATAHAVLANLAAVQGDPRSAGSHYQRLVELARDDRDNAIRSALAGARILRTTQPEIATVLYERVLEYAPAQPESSDALVERYNAEGRFTDLVRLMRARIGNLAGDARARAHEHLQLARIMGERMGDPGGALIELRHAAELAPDNPDVFSALADRHIQDGAFKNAIDALERVVELSAERGDQRAQMRALLSTAALYRRMAHHQRAEATYRAALAIDERDPDALAGAAAAAVARNNHQAAIELWQRVIALGDHPPRVAARYHLELGRSLLSAGDRDAAVTALSQATGMGSGDIAGEAHSVLADIYRDNDGGRAVRELDAAVHALTRAAESIFAQTTAELGPDETAPTGPVKSQDDQVPAVGADYKEGKRHLGRAAQLALQRAELLAGQGRAGDAERDYERAHTLARDADPDHARTAARALLQSHTQSGDKSGQRRWLDALLATRPEPGERVKLLLSRAELRAEDPDDTGGALGDIHTVLSESSDADERAIALGLQARLLAHSGDPEGQARALADRADLATTPEQRVAAESAAADAWLRASDTGEAIAAAQRAVDALAEADAQGIAIADGVRRRALELSGDMAWRRRVWKQVEVAYRALGELAANSADVAEPLRVLYNYRLACALDALGETEAAIARFLDVVAVKGTPSDIRTNAWRSLGKLYERVGELFQAARTYETLASDMRASADAEVRTDAWYRAGELYYRTAIVTFQDPALEGDNAGDISSGGAPQFEHARACLEAALAINQHHMPALDTLERIATRHSTAEELASVLGRKIDAAAGHASRQKALLSRLATIYDQRLGDPDKARASHEQALALDPDHRPSLRFVAAEELGHGRRKSAARMYRRLSEELPGDAALAGDPDELVAERVRSAQTVASIALGCPSGPEQIALIAQARQTISDLWPAAPDHPDLLDSLSALEELEADVVTAKRKPVWVAPSQRLGVARPGDGALDKQPEAGDIDGAPTAEHTARELVSDLRERADAAAEAGDNQEYASYLESLVTAMSTETGASVRPRQRGRTAEVYLELADLYYDVLGDRHKARRAMLSAAETYNAGSRHDATLRMLAAEAGADGADDVAVQAYERIESARRSPADVYNLAAAYQRLGRDHRTVAVLQEAREADQLTDQAARLLFQARQEMTSKAQRASALEARALAAPPERALDFLHEALVLHEESLADTDNAARVRQLIHEREHPELGAGSARPDPGAEAPELGAGSARPKPDAEAPEVAVDASRASSIIGGLVLQQPTEAERDAATRTAPELRLPGLWKKRSRLDQLVEAALESGDAQQAAEQLARAITLRAESGDKPGAAETTGIDETTRTALERLRTIATQAGAYEPLVRALTAAAQIEPDPVIASAWWAEISTLHREQLGSRFRSAEALSNAIAANPGNHELIEVAAELFPQLGDYPRLADAYEAHAGTLDGTERALALTELARIHWEELDDIRRAGDYLSYAYQADPTLVSIWWPLADIRAHYGDIETALALYHGVLEHAELDRATRAALTERIATLSAPGDESGAAAGTGAGPEAHGTFADQVAHEASDAIPVATSPLADGRPADQDRSVPIFGELSSAELMGQGAAMEAKGQWDAAIESYERAAVKRPGDLLPLEAIARIYSDLGEGEALLEVMDRMILRASKHTERARLYFRQAEISRDYLHRDADSYDYLKLAYDTDPDSPDIGYAFRISSMARGEWAMAAQLILDEIARAHDDPLEAGALHLELALIYDEKLLDARNAREHYETALELDPGSPATPRPLARIYELEGRFADAAAMHERAANGLRNPDQRALLMRRAAECAERAGSINNARRLYRQAVEASAHDDQLRDAASVALARLDVGSTRALSDNTMLDQRQDRIDSLRQQMTHASEAKDEPRAASLARELLLLEPADEVAYAILEAQAETDGDWAKLGQMLKNRAKALADPDDKAAAYFEFGSLSERRLRDKHAAVGAYENALRAVPNHPAALEALASIAFADQDWARARDLYGRLQAERSSISEETLAYRRGIIAEGLGHDREALEEFSRAAELAPKNAEVLVAMTRVALRSGRLDAAITAAHAQLDLLPRDDVVGLTEARLELARLYARAGEAEKAVHYNELVLAENPRYQPAMRALYTLYLERRKFEDAASTLESLISMTNSLPRRAELLYNLGELYRTQMNDGNRAADAYLKAIDLDPEHAPTLRRLIDYYWREDEPDELMDIARMLMDQGGLLDADTEARILMRTLLTASGKHRDDLCNAIAGHIGDGLATALTEVLIDSCAWEGDGPPVQALAEAVFGVSELRPEVDLPDIITDLARRGTGDTTPKLVAALRTMYSIRSRN